VVEQGSTGLKFLGYDIYQLKGRAALNDNVPFTLRTLLAFHDLTDAAPCPHFKLRWT
jgi:hypothetical protein